MEHYTFEDTNISVRPDGTIQHGHGRKWHKGTPNNSG